MLRLPLCFIFSPVWAVGNPLWEVGKNMLTPFKPTVSIFSHAGMETFLRFSHDTWVLGFGDGKTYKVCAVG